MRGFYQSSSPFQFSRVGAEPSLAQLLESIPEQMHAEIGALNARLGVAVGRTPSPAGLKEWASTSWVPFLAGWQTYYQAYHGAWRQALVQPQLVRGLFAFRDLLKTLHTYAVLHGFLPVVQEGPSAWDTAINVARGGISTQGQKALGELTVEDWLQIAKGAFSDPITSHAGLPNVETMAKWAGVGLLVLVGGYAIYKASSAAGGE